MHVQIFNKTTISYNCEFEFNYFCQANVFSLSGNTLIKMERLAQYWNSLISNCIDNYSINVWYQSLNHLTQSAPVFELYNREANPYTGFKDGRRVNIWTAVIYCLASQIATTSDLPCYYAVIIVFCNTYFN